jgi:hypothetical protein
VREHETLAGEFGAMFRKGGVVKKKRDSLLVEVRLTDEEIGPRGGSD